MGTPAWRYPNAVLDYGVVVATSSALQESNDGPRQITLSAQRTNIANGQTQDMHSDGLPNVALLLQTAERMSLVSTDAEDNATGGLGASKVLIDGVDSNGAQQSEWVDLDGTTPVLTTGAYKRVNNLLAYSDNDFSNLGDITVTSEISTTLQGVVLAGEGVTRATHFSVPEGRVLVIKNIYGIVNSTKEAIFNIEVRIPNFTGNSFVKLASLSAPVNAQDVNIAIPAGAEVKFTCTGKSDSVEATLFYTAHLLSK